MGRHRVKPEKHIAVVLKYTVYLSLKKNYDNIFLIHHRNWRRWWRKRRWKDFLKFWLLPMPLKDLLLGKSTWWAAFLSHTACPLSLSVCLSLSLSCTLTLCPPSLSLTHTLSLCLSVSLSLCPPLYLSHTFSLSLTLSLSLPPPPLSLSRFIYRHVSECVCLFLCGIPSFLYKKNIIFHQIFTFICSQIYVDSSIHAYDSWPLHLSWFFDLHVPPYFQVFNYIYIYMHFYVCILFISYIIYYYCCLNVLYLIYQ